MKDFSSNFLNFLHQLEQSCLEKQQAPMRVLFYPPMREHLLCCREMSAVIACYSLPRSLFLSS